MKILVTGANGMLGQDLCPILEDEGYAVIETDIENLDITDCSAVLKMIQEEKPEVVIHCAAYTDVDAAETDLEKALLINGKGTENLAQACANAGATMLYISTDYVFDGMKDEAYLPADETNPINNYGLSKLKGEEAVKKHCEKYYIVRTSWLYGHHGKNFVETMLSLSEQPEINVVDDQTGCPTWTVDLANGIVDILEEEKAYGVYHLCGAGKTTWYGFAQEIFKQEGLEVNLAPCTTAEYPRPAKRPMNSVMNNGKACRDWKLALKDYLMLRF